MRKVTVSCVVYYVYEAEIFNDVEAECDIIAAVDGQDPVYRKICDIASKDGVGITAAEICSVMDAETGEILSE